MCCHTKEKNWGTRQGKEPQRKTFCKLCLVVCKGKQIER